MQIRPPGNMHVFKQKSTINVGKSTRNSCVNHDVFTFSLWRVTGTNFGGHRHILIKVRCERDQIYSLKYKKIIATAATSLTLYIIKRWTTAAYSHNYIHHSIWISFVSKLFQIYIFHENFYIKEYFTHEKNLQQTNIIKKVNL